ncbi:MAG: hypothetical protein V3R85_10700, partial [Alphaproteobacteria bacterium]
MADTSDEQTTPSESGMARRIVDAAAFLITAVCVLWAVQAQHWVGVTFFPQSVLALILGLSVFIAWVTLRADGSTQGPVP